MHSNPAPSQRPTGSSKSKPKAIKNRQDTGDVLAAFDDNNTDIDATLALADRLDAREKRTKQEIAAEEAEIARLEREEGEREEEEKAQPVQARTPFWQTPGDEDCSRCCHAHCSGCVGCWSAVKLFIANRLGLR